MTSGDLEIARAAGAVAHRTAGHTTEVLLIHRPRYDDWSLPKGHLDTGETYEAAAVREVEEETGYTGELGGGLGAVGYRTNSKQKVVRYWLLTVTGGEFRPNKEADAIQWLPIRKAKRLTSYARDRNVLMRAERELTRSKSAVVHLVRHAHAGQRKSWQEADHLRPLSAKGLRQAATIKERLLELPVDTVHSSHYERCDQTVRPYAQALDLDVAHEPSLVEGAAPEDQLQFLGSLSDTAAVVCTHGDVISGLLGHLQAEGVDFADRLQWKKASIWTLDLLEGRVRGGLYTPPPSSG